MTALPGDTSTLPPDRVDLLASLKADAEYLQPRLFAIYGIQSSTCTSGFEIPFLGWGLDCCREGGAVFVDPRDGGAHCSDSAERILAVYQRLGEAHLMWLD